MSSRRRSAGDEGATAILTAVMAALLFVVAALAVEVTSAYSREAAVRSVADQAARDGAAALPLSCDAVLAAARSLAAVDNRVADDAGAPDLPMPASIAEASALLDGDTANGEVTVFGPDIDPAAEEGAVDLTDCLQPGTRIRVVAPPRTVRFSFGRLAGPEQVAVGAAATAGIVSALPLLPLALPDACRPAPSHTLVLRQPGLSSAVDLPREADAPDLRSMLLLPAGLPGPTQLTLDVLEGESRAGVAGYSVWFTSDGGDVYAATPAVAAVPPLAGVPGLRTVTVPVPAPVLDRPGDWAVRVSVAALAADPAATPGPWSQTQRLSRPEIPICDPTGRYGSLLTITPSQPADPLAERVRSAAVDGLTYPTMGTVTINGPATHNSLADPLSTGLLQRLGRAAPPPCSPPGMSLGAWSHNGVTITANNALSCYWTDVAPMVTPGIIDEPRAFLVPVVAAGSTKPVADTSVAVIDHVVAYVSREIPGTPGGLIGGPGVECVPGTPTCNGVTVGTTGQLERLTIFQFEAYRLPSSVRVEDDGHPYTVGTTDVLLLD